MFSFIKNTLSKIYTHVTSQVHKLFLQETIDTETLKELERILIQADTGVPTTKKILSSLSDKVSSGEIKKGTDLQEALKQELIQILTSTPQMHDAQMYLFVGINGSGKTTAISKLAYRFKQEGKRVLLVAADTFRAAAVEQLQSWAQKIDVDIVTGSETQDPAAVVFQGCEQFKKGAYDVLLIDTAGRLQTKTNLMKELEKITRVIDKQLPEQTCATLLTIDAMLGQNSVDQARLFHESTTLSGLVLTKLDGTGKGGIIFSIAHELNLPVVYISFGEQLEQLKRFEPEVFINELIS